MCFSSRNANGYYLDLSNLVGDVFVYISFLRVAAANKLGNAEFASLALSVSLAASRCEPVVCQQSTHNSAMYWDSV